MPVNNSVAVTNGNAVVTGYLTQFVGLEDDTFNLNGISVPIAAVDNTAQITLAYPWPGTTQVDQVNWVILKTSPFWSSGIVIGANIEDLVRRVREGLPFKPDGVGDLPYRANFDDAPRGFIYLRTDTNPFLVYVRESDEPGGWTAGQAMKGESGGSYEFRVQEGTNYLQYQQVGGLAGWVNVTNGDLDVLIGTSAAQAAASAAAADASADAAALSESNAAASAASADASADSAAASAAAAAVYDPSTLAPKASPIFTGDPRAPTPATGDNDTSIATTAFVKAQNYAAASHTHTIANVTSLQTTLDAKGNLTGGNSWDGIQTFEDGIKSYRENLNAGNEGIVWLNLAGDRYVGWDGTRYQMPGADLSVNGRFVVAEIDLKAPIANPTFTGAITTPALTISGTIQQINFYDTDWAGTRYLHHNNGSLGFLNNAGAWVMRNENNGNLILGEATAGGGSTFFYNGDIYMVWAGNYLSNVLASKNGPASFIFYNAEVGYFRIPSNQGYDWIIQWGRTYGAADLVIGFPLSFPNTCHTVVATVDDGYHGTGSGRMLTIYGKAAGSFSSAARAQSGGTTSGVACVRNWIAIGY